MTAAGMKTIDQAKSTGTWEAHAETDALTMPPELKRALDGNDSARKNWPTYTASQQKAFLRMLHDAKTPDTRAKRIARILDIVSKRITFAQLLKGGGAAKRTRPTGATASRGRGSTPSRRPR
jgi:uncharacterized protein YdeI (YjbR/CyaY-like superfamily)